MKMNKKLIAGVMLAVMSAAVFTGCGGEKKEEAAPAAGGKIVVISREDGSGTRGAFIELFGIEKKGDDGKKVDMTTQDASITNSTAVMMTTVAGNRCWQQRRYRLYFPRFFERYRQSTEN